MTDYRFASDDGTLIHALRWDIPNPAGIVQIIHGMAEHIARYDEFARYLNSRGFLVAGEDHRGHGKTTPDETHLGYFAHTDGWNRVIRDNAVLGRQLREDYPGIPYYLIGMSMGSFLLRKMVVDYPDHIDKIILLAGGDLPDVQVYGLTVLIKILNMFQSRKKKSKIIDKLSFAKLNDQFTPGETGFEWVSRDKKEVDAYLKDPLCGFVCTLGFFRDFAYGMRYLKKDEPFQKTPKDLPILFYSGDQDPLGANGAFVNKIADRYRQHGCTQVEVQFNHLGRHDSLHETNRDEVFAALADWLEEKTP